MNGKKGNLRLCDPDGQGYLSLRDNNSPALRDAPLTTPEKLADYVLISISHILIYKK